MASIVKFASKTGISGTLLSKYKHSFLRHVSTSSSNKEGSVPVVQKGQYQQPPDFSKPLENPNWLSYGYSYEDEKEDRVKAHSYMFWSVLSMLYFSLFVMYMPDYKHKDWAKREAYILLEERERTGQELVSPNYVDPSKIVLPSDEELGDMEIII